MFFLDPIPECIERRKDKDALAEAYERNLEDLLEVHEDDLSG
jgi:hypothetical protein